MHILLKTMASIKLNILDCSLQRRIKPIQNISLMVFSFSWVFIFILLFFNSNWASILFYVFFVLSIVSIIIFIITSLFFLNKKKIGLVEIDKEKIVINGKKYSFKDCYLDLNSDFIEGYIYDKKSIKNLPFWGNYIINTKNNIRIEFEPIIEIEKSIPYIEIKNTKRSAFSMKTTDLFKSLMSILWASS